MEAQGRGEPLGVVSWRELVVVVLVATGFMLLTLAPYLWANALTPPGSRYTWFLWGVDDGNVYLSWIRQAAEGRLTFDNQYGPPVARHAGLFFNVFLLWQGWIAGLTGLQPITVFHLSRLVAGVFCLTAFYGLVALAFRQSHVRVVALTLACTSSGLGWAVHLATGGGHVAAAPIDFTRAGQEVPEATTFPSLLFNPLFAAGEGLMCLTLLLALLAWQRQRMRYALGAGLALLVLGNIHSYDIFAVHAVLGLLTLGVLVWGGARRWWGLGAYAVIVALSLAAPLWALYVIHSDPDYAAKVATKTLSPGVLGYVWGYGLVLLLAILGAVHLLRRRSAMTPGAWALVLWAAMGGLLLYAPVAFQRKLAEGLHLPLCALAAVGVVLVLGPLTAVTADAGHGARAVAQARRRFWLLVAVCVAATVPSNVFLLAQLQENALANNTNVHPLMPPLYVDDTQAQALRWLAQQVSESDVVFSTSLVGNFIPAHTAAHVVAGHWAETVNFGRALAAVGHFYWPQQRPQVRRDILRQFQATYVYFGPYERWYGQSFATDYTGRAQSEPTAEELEALPFLEMTFRNGKVVIYEVLVSALEEGAGREQ